MIYDCFMFHNEWDILELRLAELYDHVDCFVIMEGDKTHAGKDRVETLSSNSERYKKWWAKMKIGMVGLPGPIDGNRFTVDVAQRNSIKVALEQWQIASMDWVIISDCDEIPDMRTWNGNEGSFACLNSAFKLNTVHPTQQWNGPCIVRAWRFWSPFSPCSPQDVRNFRDVFRTVGTGWHFGWTTDPEQKKRDFAHSEMDDGEKVDPSFHPGERVPLLKIQLDEQFPSYLVENQNRFSHLISEVS